MQLKKSLFTHHLSEKKPRPGKVKRASGKAGKWLPKRNREGETLFTKKSKVQHETGSVCQAEPY